MARRPDPLAPYHAKRDFARTPEPRGAPAKQGQALRFIVHRHAATRLHYDLRLEWGGVLKSWAVTRGPSLDPADKRLAVEVEDHPLDYGSFEGTIPKPGYGAGTVQIWDRGAWAPLHPKTVDADLARGELKFVVSGERLKGGFVLIRLKPRAGETPGRHNWLLIKEKDSMATPDAGDAVLQAATSVESGRTLEEIAGAKVAPKTATSGKTKSVEPPAGPPEPVVSEPAEFKLPSGKRKAAMSAATSAKSAPSKPVAPKAGSKKPAVAKPSTSKPAAANADPLKPIARKLASPNSASLPAALPRATPPKASSVKPATAAKRVAGTPSPMPDFVAPQLCRLVATPPRGEHWIHELKLDGYRVQLHVAGHQAALRTRTGLDWTDRFAALAKAAASLPDCLLDGEVVALDDQGHPNFSRLQAMLSGDVPPELVFYLFDLLHDGTRDCRGDPLLTRKTLLSTLLQGAPASLRYLDHFTAPGEAVLASACRLSMEGIVSKRGDQPYASGRNDSWTKAKCRGREEFIIGGWSRDKAGRGLGALLVGARRGKTLAYLGRVGTGFSGRTAERLLAQMKPFRRDTTPFDGAPPARTSDVTWVDPELVAEIAFGGWTEAGILRHASFLGLREDKPAAEVVVEAVVPTKAESGKKPPPEPLPSAPRKPKGTARLTHPERVIWPATEGHRALTKGDLAAYFERYADRILAHVAGRPLSILRAPDGIGGEVFFQRHAMRGQSPLIGAVEVEGQARPYMRIDDAAGLMALAQVSAVELHPWGALGDRPDVPERLVFDLDPDEGLAFPDVVAGALALHERLEALGLITFPRATGGKGLHLVVPLDTSGTVPDWSATKQFARLVCSLMKKDAPGRYTTTLAKKARSGRIFLDYLRNDRLSTAIASWSPRARAGAPIARPITWAEVKPSLDPAGWRLDALVGKAPAKDPWAGFEDAARPLRPAIERAMGAPARKKA